MLNQHKQGFYEKRVDNHGFSFFPKEDKSKSKAKGKRKMENRVGGTGLFPVPTSHTTVRTVRYTGDSLICDETFR